MLNSILPALLPCAVLVALGGIIRGHLSAEAWRSLDKVNFNLLMPALLFVSASQRPISLESIAIIGPGVLLILAIGVAVSWTARSFGPKSFLDFAGAWQAAWRVNSAIALVAIGSTSQADTSLMAIAVGVAVPLNNVVAISVLSRGTELNLLSALRRIALNPFLLSSLAGVLVGLSQMHIPDFAIAPLDLMGRGAVPIALLSVGATMNWRALAHLDRFCLILNATKLVVLPAIVTGICLLMSYHGEIAAVLVLFAAMPTAVASHIAAGEFGADRELVATLVAQSTMLAAFTLPIWIVTIQYLVI